MAKKYHQTSKDRRHESHGMERYHDHADRLDSGYMGMLSEDHSAPANLPQHVVHEYYEKCDYLDMHELDDTARGIDDDIDNSIERIERHPSDSKY